MTPDYLGALHGLVMRSAELSGRPIPAGNIFRAWPNRVPLPEGSDEYVILTTVSISRRGTNV